MSETKFPRVSILIPVYNREDFIAECVQSALRQTMTDIEVVVVDNASTDRTWEICQGLAARDERLRVFRNEKNIGPVRNWLKCVRRARGEYSKILWSDDLIHPDFLRKLLPCMDDPSVGFVYSSVLVFTGNSPERGRPYYVSRDTGVYEAGGFIVSALLNGGVPVSPGCALFRTVDVMANLKPDVPNRVDSDFSMHAIGNDLLLFLLTAKDYPAFAVVNEALSYFRDHCGSITMAAMSSSDTVCRIPLHYDLAKGFFVENYINDLKLIKKFNMILFSHLLKYRDNAYGIKKLDDFYPTRDAGSISWTYLLVMFIKKIRMVFVKTLPGMSRKT